MSGWTTMPPDIRALAEELLTERELDVIKLRAEGKGTYRIAAILGISGTRVKQLRRSADNKMRRPPT